MKLLPKIIIYVLFLVAYSLLVFLLNADYTVVFALAYAFAVLAVLVQFTCTILVDKKIKAEFLTYHLVFVLLSYTVINLIANTLCAFFHREITYLVPLLVNVCLLAGYTIYFIIHFNSVKAIESNVKEERARLQFVRVAAQKLELIMSSITDIYVSKKVEILYDAVRGSQALGNEGVAALELEILSDIDMLQILYDDDNFEGADRLSQSILTKLNRRNAYITSSQVV